MRSPQQPCAVYKGLIVRFRSAAFFYVFCLFVCLFVFCLFVAWCGTKLRRAYESTALRRVSPVIIAVTAHRRPSIVRQHFFAYDGRQCADLAHDVCINQAYRARMPLPNCYRYRICHLTVFTDKRRHARTRRGLKRHAEMFYGCAICVTFERSNARLPVKTPGCGYRAGFWHPGVGWPCGVIAQFMVL